MNEGAPTRFGVVVFAAAVVALAMFLGFDRVSGPASAETPPVAPRPTAAPGPSQSVDEAIAKVNGRRERGALRAREQRRVRSARRKRRERSVVERTVPYGSRRSPPAGWIQNGPGATAPPNVTSAAVAAFRANSCVHASACPGGEPIAVDVAEKRADFLRGLMDDRVTRLLLWIAEDHRILVTSARGSHSRYVQDGTGRRVVSNHYLGRAADISAVDGVPCVNETRGKAFDGSFDNAPPASAGRCTSLANEINQAPDGLAPTETIFYFSVGPPSGVSLENHDDHVHIGFDSF